MRTIETQMLDAINNKKNFSKSNTMVCIDRGNNTLYGDRAEVFLFGNHIGDYWYQEGKFEVNERTLIDWPSVTTKSRLRALGVDLRSVKGKLVLNGCVVLGDHKKYDALEGDFKPKGKTVNELWSN